VLLDVRDGGAITEQDDGAELRDDPPDVRLASYRLESLDDVDAAWQEDAHARISASVLIVRDQPSLRSSMSFTSTYFLCDLMAMKVFIDITWRREREGTANGRKVEGFPMVQQFGSGALAVRDSLSDMLCAVKSWHSTFFPPIQ
jgi:hypothetical protein